jgi:hypothetical protein
MSAISFPANTNNQNSDAAAIQLSDDTEKARIELAKLQKLTADYQGEADALLNDDAGNIEKLAGKIGSLRAAQELLVLRVGRLKDKLFECLRRDCILAQQNAEHAEAAAYAGFKKAKDGWNNELNTRFKGDPGGRLKFQDPAWYPLDVRELYNKWRAAQKTTSTLATLRGQIDPPEAWKHEAHFDPRFVAGQLLVELKCNPIQPAGTKVTFPAA